MAQSPELAACSRARSAGAPVIMLAPALNHDLRFLEGRENLPVENLVA